MYNVCNSRSFTFISVNSHFSLLLLLTEPFCFEIALNKMNYKFQFENGNQLEKFPIYGRPDIPNRLNIIMLKLET